MDDLEDYLPEETTEIISGGARGVDASAKAYALQHGLKLTEYLPEYARYGRTAPLIGYVADYEGRSVNSHVLVLIRQNIKMFEAEHGVIEGTIPPYDNVKPPRKG